MRRWFLHLWLVLLLLGSQQLSFAHALTHVPTPAHQHDSKAPGTDKPCAQCLAMADFDDVLPSVWIPPAPPAAFNAPPAETFRQRLALAPLLGFHSRAPPSASYFELHY